MQDQLILASQSPRRIQLLQQIGLEFRVQPSEIVEVISPKATPIEAVESLAQQKAQSVAKFIVNKKALVIGADTIVEINGGILGKPESLSQAEELLTQLSGKRHCVATGVALVPVGLPDQASVLFHEITYVRIPKFSSAFIREYVTRTKPLDKAGAYGIQDDLGSVLVEAIEGDYFNVMGFPVNRFIHTMKVHFPSFLTPFLRK